MKLANKTINNITDMLSTMLNYAYKKDMIAKNPLSKLTKLRVNNKRERFLSVSEIEHLLNAVKDDEILTLFCALSLSTGARFKSILDLRRKDIIFDTKMIQIEDQKTMSYYNGFCCDFSYKKLLAFKDKAPNTKIFDINPKTVQTRLQNILNQLFNVGLSKDDRKNRVVIHTLRHTFASHLAINNTPIAIIQKLLNHKDIRMTLRYAKLMPNSGRNFVEQLPFFDSLK